MATDSRLRLSGIEDGEQIEITFHPSPSAEPRKITGEVTMRYSDEKIMVATEDGDMIVNEDGDVRSWETDEVLGRFMSVRVLT